ncbi:MAG TPA: NAD-binding protein [Acidimicrobiia bacterium]
MRNPLRALVQAPIVQRVAWHVRRIASRIEGGFFRPLLAALAVTLALASVVVWFFETERTLVNLGEAIYWASTTVLGQGDAGFASGPVGWVVGWLLGLFGVGIVATMTGVLVGFVIEYLLKEGQGMGASGYRDHVVVCGWNPTARELIDELAADDSTTRIVVICDTEKTPTEKAYFVRGETTNEEDLKRAGIEFARSAIVCPSDSSNEADIHSILTVLAIENLAPQVRTVVEVNNPANVPHFRRANVDELLVTSRLSSRLLARSALYPGLAELVTDIVGGAGNDEDAELYRVRMPEEAAGMSTTELQALMRQEHHATVLAVIRAGQTIPNPPHGFRMEPDDELVVLAYDLGSMEPVVDEKKTRDGADPVLGIDPAPSPA